jgi:hypothetical protein
MIVPDIGAVIFGIVIGWVTYRTLRRDTVGPRLSDLATVVAAVGGAAVTALFPTPDLFGYYAIGLGAGFFGYLILGHTVLKDSPWLGSG